MKNSENEIAILMNLDKIELPKAPTITKETETVLRKSQTLKNEVSRDNQETIKSDSNISSSRSSSNDRLQ